MVEDDCNTGTEEDREDDTKGGGGDKDVVPEDLLAAIVAVVAEEAITVVAGGLALVVEERETAFRIVDMLPAGVVDGLVAKSEPLRDRNVQGPQVLPIVLILRWSSNGTLTANIRSSKLPRD
jgi:hypothetical protein